MVLLGVLIPIFQTAQAKSDEVRGELERPVRTLRRRDQGRNRPLRRRSWKRSRTSPRSTYITKQQALQTLKSELKDKSIVDELHTNPLPASFQVKADDAANLPAIEAAVDADGPERQAEADQPGDLQLLRPPAGPQQIEKVTSALKIVLTVITALLIVASLMLIGNTIRLSIFTRRREVEVMRLVGATRWFIRWPFMIEGVVVGFIGGLVAILILWIGKITIVDPLSDTNSFLAAQHNSTLAFPVLIAILFGAAVLVSTIGSGVTLRRFLKV